MKNIVFSILGSAILAGSASGAYIFDATAVTNNTIAQSNTNWFGSIFTLNGYYTLEGFAVYDPSPAGFTTFPQRQIVFGQMIGGVPTELFSPLTVTNGVAPTSVGNPLGAPAGFPADGTFRDLSLTLPELLVPGTYFIGYSQGPASNAAARDGVLLGTGVTIDPSVIAFAGSIQDPQSAIFSGPFGGLTPVVTGAAQTAYLGAMPNLTIVPEVGGSMMALVLGGMLTGVRLRRRTVTA